MNTRNTQNQNREIIILPRNIVLPRQAIRSFDAHAKIIMIDQKYAERKSALKKQLEELPMGKIVSSKKRMATLAMTFLFMISAVIPILQFGDKAEARIISQGPNSAAGTGDCVNQPGGLGAQWTNPGNGFSSNNTYATSTTDGTGTYDLKCTNFGFSIPSSAEVKGIVAGIERKSDSTGNGGTTDFGVSLIKNGSPAGSNRATTTVWPTTDTYEDHGGSTDLWGTTLTPADVNATNFGILASAIKANAAGAGHNVSIDHIRLTVYYSANAKVEQNGYIWENDDSTNGGSAQEAGNTAITGVRKGERMSLRMQVKNTGNDDMNTKFGLFYDQNDGNFTQVRETTIKQETGSGCSLSSWTCSSIDTNTLSPSLSQSPSGVIYYSYHDSLNGDLKVAQYVGTGGTGCSTSTWSCTAVDSTGTVGNFSSLSFSTAGVAYISYYDQTNADLKVAQYVGSGGTGCATTAWTCTTVDNTSAITGQDTSIALSPSGVPYVSFRDVTNADLKVAQYVGSGGTGCATTAWTCTAIDSTNSVGDYTSIAFNSDGVAFISYQYSTSADLRVAQYVGSGGTGCATTAWTCTNIDTAQVTGDFTFLAFSPSGAPYISYQDTTGGATDLHVAQYVGSGGTGCATTAWTCTTVDSTGDVGANSAIAFSPSGAPYVSYWDSTNSSVKLANYVGSGGTGCAVPAWTCNTVKSSVTSGKGLIFGADGNPLLSYRSATDLGLAKLTRSGAISFSPSTNSGSITSSHADMSTVSDSSNKSDSDCIGGGTWQNGVIATGPEVTVSLPAGYCTEIVFTIDTSQASYGSTYRFVVASLDALRQEKGRWRGPSTIASGAYATLTMGSDTDAVTLRASKDVEPQGSTCASAAWTCTAVDTANSTGDETSIAFSPNGTPYISYFDSTSFDLRVAQYVGTGGTGCAISSWTCTTVDSAGTLGQMSSVAVSVSGVPYVSYFDVGGKVKVAQYVGTGGTGCATTSWTCTDIDSDVINQDLGQDTSIAISPGGIPYVTYIDNFNQTVKVAYYVGSGGNCGSSAWKCSSVDNNVIAGSSTSIAFSPAGVPYFSYQDGIGLDLILAQYVGSGGTGCNSTDWTCTSVVTTDSVGSRSSLAFSPSGNPFISYYSQTNGDFFVAEYVGSGGTGCATTTWKCTNVDSANAYGLYNSLAFSPSGVPFASYWDNTNSDLRLAYYVGSGGTGCASSAWTCTSVESTNDVGNYNSIAFSPSGTPYISYTDKTNFDLRVAKLSFSSEKLIATTQYKYAGNRNGTISEGRFHLADGRLGRVNAFGRCAGAGAALMGYCGLFNDDGNIDSIAAQINESPLFNFNFKVKSNNELPTLSWIGRTTLAPNTAGTTGDLKLQIYKFGSTNAWVDVATNTSSSNCNTENCKLIGIPSGTASDFFEVDGSDYRIHVRVYQNSSGSSAITLSTDNAQLQYLSGQMRHGMRFENGVKRPASW